MSDKFEYVIHVDKLHVDKLNAMGQEGWRYVDRVDDPSGSGHSVLFFERKISSKSDFGARMAEARAAKKAKKEVPTVLDDDFNT